MTFHPELCGSYEAELRVCVSQVTETEHGDNAFTASLTLKAEAEDPQVELSPQSHAPVGDLGVLDFGVLVGGTSAGMPLALINRGRSKVPLNLSISSEVRFLISGQIFFYECSAFFGIPHCTYF